MRRFATGLRKDLPAVRAGFELLRAKMLAA
jgi:hypothetical protein